MRARRLSYDISAEVIGGDEDVEEKITGQGSPDSSAETGQDRFDSSGALMTLMDKNLTKKQKCYIILYYREGLTERQIAERFGVDKSTVSRTISRGRERLACGISRQALSTVLNRKRGM